MVKKKVDLHIHTNQSDGTWDNQELLQKIREKEIDIFSITDHDNIENTKLMLKNNLESNLLFIPGVELSCTYDHQEYHITSYKFFIDNQSLNGLLQYNQKVRKQFNKNIIVYFENKYNLDLINNYVDYDNDRKKGGWKTLNFLFDQNLIDGLDDFFDKIIDMNEEMIFPPPKEVIDIVHQANGFAFLAHPASYFKGELLNKEILSEWIELGIDGIEVYSPYLRKKSDAEYYKDFCKNNNLMISGGSDCHGDFIKKRKLGEPEIYLDDLEINKLLKK